MKLYEVAPNFFIRGDFKNLEEPMDLVVCLIRSCKHSLEGMNRIQRPLPDGKEIPSALVNEIGDEIIKHLDKGERVLVHCRAGTNRSGLIAGVVMGKLGGENVLENLQGIRPGIMGSNPQFMEFVKNLG